MRARSFSIILAIITTAFMTAGMAFLKPAALMLPQIGAQLVLGILMYAIAAVCLVYALKEGNLTVIFPILSTAVVWVSMIAIIFFNEAVGMTGGAGILLIVTGSILVSRGQNG